MCAAKALIVKPYNALSEKPGNEDEVTVAIVATSDETYGVI